MGLCFSGRLSHLLCSISFIMAAPRNPSALVDFYHRLKLLSKQTLLFSCHQERWSWKHVFHVFAFNVEKFSYTPILSCPAPTPYTHSYTHTCTHSPVCLSLSLGLGVDGTAWVLKFWWSDDSLNCVGCMLCYVNMAKGLQILTECQSGVLGGYCQWGNFTLTFCSLPLSANPGSPPQTKCQSHVTFQGGCCQPGQLEFLTM